MNHENAAQTIIIDGHNLNIENFIAITVNKTKVSLAEQTREQIVKIRAKLDEILSLPTDEQPLMYGVNTGVGMHKHEVVSKECLDQYQIDYINSHSCGTGEPLTETEVRALMLLRLNSLIQGHSGVHPDTIQRFVEALNADFYPYVPRKGSVGASGDLTPLAHLVGSLMGLENAYAFINEEKTPATVVLKNINLTPLKLHPKEAMGLTNGAVLVLTDLIFAAIELKDLVLLADLAAALSVEAMRGEPGAFDERIHALRPHRGQSISASNIRKCLQDSQWVGIDAQKINIKDPQGPANKPRVQDAYSLRCAPQVHGPVHDTLKRAIEVALVEMNSGTDNPLFFMEGEKLKVISGGNFHGTETGYQADFLKIAATDIANISDRRLYRLINADLSYGLPQDLSGVPAGATRGSTGLMIAQYATAALINESKVLATPATTDSIPTSGHQEDHVSMGTTAARLLRQVVKNLRRVLATEIMAACQAISIIESLMNDQGFNKRGAGTTVAYNFVRQYLPAMQEDRNLKADIDIVENLLINKSLIQEVQKASAEPLEL